MENYEPEIIETPEAEENIETLYNVSILDEEYELSMKISESLLELKIQQKDIIDEYYYKSKYDLQTINKLLSTSFKGIKEAFDFFDKIINEKNVNLVQSKDKNIINLNYKNIAQNTEINLELMKSKLTKDEMNVIFLKEINTLKKELKSKNEKSIDELIKENNKQLNEYINKKFEEYEKIFLEKMEEKDNEINKLKKIIEKLIPEQEKKLNKVQNDWQIISEEKKSLLEENKKVEKNNDNKLDENDNINLIDDFNNINVNNMKVNLNIVNNLNIRWTKSVAVYKIKRNNEISYEIAFPDNKNGFNIIIYNILSRKINTIKNAHQNEINTIKHYYYSLNKYHILLTSSKDKSVKLWNISSNPVSNILHISNCFNGNNWSPFCLMFDKNNKDDDDYYIIGGTYFNKKNIWNKNGVLYGSIEKSQLNYYKFIEATYIDNKPYILLSGVNHSECYDYYNNTIKIYQPKKKNNQHWIANLFNKNNKIYLISGDNGGNVIIFDFISTNEISSISIGGDIYSLCSINEKYILVGDSNKKLSVIDFDNKSIIKNYKGHNKAIYGIEKIKVDGNKEYIITYDENEIKLWK